MSLGRTALYYKKNKKARDKKYAYDKKYNASDKQKKYRVALNRARRKRKLKGDPRDLSHTKGGNLVLENASKNRARNGANGKSTKK